jgi:hypothetical protein
MANQLPVNSLIAAGKATATTTEQVIDADDSYGGFRKILIDCTNATDEIMLSIDKPIASSTKIIYVSAGNIFVEHLNGDKLYYKCASGTSTFNYVLL